MRRRQDEDELIAAAAQMADAARVATLRHFRSAGLSAETKEADRFDPVTVADRESEAAMRAVLARLRPQDAILGEEQAPHPGTSGLTWVIDPIDGTRGYLSGTPTWGVLISVADADGPIYGIIDQPYIGERFEGGFGRAQVVGPMGRHALRCRPARPLGQAILFSTFPEVGTDIEHQAFRRVADRVRLVRYGCDCYGYALVAAGQIDLVIEAAGGIVTDWQGRPCPMGGRVLAAANAEVHAQAMALLNG